MKILFYANRLKHVVKVRPLTESRFDITRIKLALDLRKPLGDFSDLTLWWRAVRVAVTGAKSLTEVRARVAAVAVGMFRTAKLLESYATGELTQLFRVNQIPGAYESDNPLVQASGLAETYADRLAGWGPNTTVELVNFAMPNSGPMPSAHEVVELAAFIANLPLREVRAGAPWHYNELVPSTVPDLADAVFATRFLEQVRYKVNNQEVAVEAGATQGNTIPERAALLRAHAAELLSCELSALKMYGEHLLGWISHPYCSPYLAAALRDEYERAASTFAFTAAPINVQGEWQNLLPIAKRPIPEGALLDAPIWGTLYSAGMPRPPSVPTPQETFVPVKAGVGLAFVADRSYEAAQIKPMAHTPWLLSLAEITGQIGRLLASVNGLDLSTAGSHFAPLQDYVPAAETVDVEKTQDPIAWGRTTSGMPVASSDMFFALLENQAGLPVNDPAALLTIAKLKRSYGEARGTGVLNFVGSTAVDERRQDYDDRLIVPMTPNDMLRDAAHAKPSLDGLLHLWGKTKGLWDLETRAISLANPNSMALRVLASALRFVGVLYIDYGIHTDKRHTVTPILPRQRHWYHGTYDVVEQYLAADADAFIELIGPRPIELDIQYFGTMSERNAVALKGVRSARLVLKPFAVVPACSATHTAPGSLKLLPLPLMRKEAAAVSWVSDKDPVAGNPLERVRVCPPITAWARSREPISDVHLVYKVPNEALTHKLDLHGSATAPQWACQKNGLAQLIGSDAEPIPADLLMGRNFDDVIDDGALSTSWDGTPTHTAPIIQLHASAAATEADT